MMSIGASATTFTGYITLWLIFPSMLVAVTVTLYLPRAERVLVVLTAAVEEAVPPELRTTALGLTDTVTELTTGVMETASVTVPAKPLRLVRVSARPPVEPAEMVSNLRLAVSEKSGAGMTTVTTVE